jgi:hypothetical protein
LYARGATHYASASLLGEDANTATGTGDTPELAVRLALERLAQRHADDPPLAARALAAVPLLVRSACYAR